MSESTTLTKRKAPKAPIRRLRHGLVLSALPLAVGEGEQKQALIFLRLRRCLVNFVRMHKGQRTSRHFLSVLAP
ncbi:hypothetical protein BDW71DRAFT_187057 [Aspergillus fruticulosus]